MMVFSIWENGIEVAGAVGLESAIGAAIERWADAYPREPLVVVKNNVGMVVWAARPVC